MTTKFINKKGVALWELVLWLTFLSAFFPVQTKVSAKWLAELRALQGERLRYTGRKSP